MIEVREVVKSYTKGPVLDGITLSISEGETVIILGESGSGKSTLLKLILGLDGVDEGKILIEGQEITGLSETDLMEVRKKFGMVFQEAALFDSLTVGENVGFRLYEESKIDPDEIANVVQKLLGFVGLEDAVDKTPAELSGGMKRRVSIARALLGNPRVLLYDEPTAGLDALTSRTILELLVRLRDLEGVTSVVVTHDLKTARLLANEYATVTPNGTVEVIAVDDKLCLLKVKFVMLYNGKVIFEGNLADLQNTESEYVRNFVSQLDNRQ